MARRMRSKRRRGGAQTLIGAQGSVLHERKRDLAARDEAEGVRQPGAGPYLSVPAGVGHDFGQIPIHASAPPILQAKLTVSEPGDRHEREADRVAEVVTRIPGPEGQGTVRDREESPEEVHPQANDLPNPAPRISADFESHISSARGQSKPLSDSARTFFEPRFGHDFSRVHIHTDASAMSAARQLNAEAFTRGQEVFFAAGRYQPHTTPGRRLLAHELVHVVQQDSAGSGRVATIQRKIVPEDVADEMIGREFELTKPFKAVGATLKAGDRVTVIAWDNKRDTVSVIGGGAFAPFFTPKKLLKPTRPVAPGVAPYSAGVTGQAAAVEKSEQKLAAWVARESAFKTKKAQELFKAERKRLEGLLKRRQEILNRKLIQETMFSRFDPVIKREVEAANKSHGLKSADALDPNLLKSMLFQESQLGTAGTHLEVPPSHPVRTRFNIGQVIDSSGLALMTLLEREQPALMKAKLPNMRKDLETAQKERKTLKKKKTPTASESARLAELDGLAMRNWEFFIWSYRSPTTGERFADVVADFFASQTPGLNVDYDFWIHMAVMWLFEKHKTGMTWPDAIKAYNGSGKRAEHYRDAVVKRAKGAKEAEKAGVAFIPGKI